MAAPEVVLVDRAARLVREYKVAVATPFGLGSTLAQLDHEPVVELLASESPDVPGLLILHLRAMRHRNVARWVVPDQPFGHRALAPPSPRLQLRLYAHRVLVRLGLFVAEPAKVRHVARGDLREPLALGEVVKRIPPQISPVK
jgi:hypothetical protein